MDTVAARVLDLLGVEHEVGKRWGEVPAVEDRSAERMSQVIAWNDRGRKDGNILTSRHVPGSTHRPFRRGDSVVSRARECPTRL